MDVSDKKRMRKKRIRNIMVSILLCMVFMVLVFTSFFGLAVYQGNFYGQTGGKSYLLYAQKYDKLNREDALLIQETDNQQIKLKKAADLSDEKDDSYQIIGKVLLHW